ncbi:MAG TPA: phosphoglycerate kinase [Desulfobacteraceae bacterium]|nr:phosphoglycerate kinase [Desulfobacteraceae bacterium]
MKTIRELDVQGKRVLIRVDYNVPLDEAGIITDDIRIRMSLPTIRYAVEQGAKVILCSHMGRPKGKRVAEFSLAPAARALSVLLDKPVVLAPDCIGPEAEAVVNGMRDGDVVLLENLRYHAGEEQNDPEFARGLAALADMYVNDAFAVSHRAHASVEGVTRYCAEKAAGFLLQKEMEYFHRSMAEPVRPLVAIIGGAKVSSKLGALENMLDKVDRLLIGGAMANTFLKSRGLDVGASKVEDELLGAARQILDLAREKGVKVYLPVDVIAADRFAADAVSKQVPVQDIPPGWMALDIGPATVLLFTEALADARTIVWNGPMGAFEMDAFSRGTMALAHAVAAAHALSITGGGDSNAAIKKSGEADRISYMSTGGGAFLELMEGKTLPGVAALETA